MVLQLYRSDGEQFNSLDGISSAGQRGKACQNQKDAGAAPSPWLESSQFSQSYCSRHSAGVSDNVRKCRTLHGGYDPVGVFICPGKSGSRMLLLFIHRVLVLTTLAQ